MQIANQLITQDKSNKHQALTKLFIHINGQGNERYNSIWAKWINAAKSVWVKLLQLNWGDILMAEMILPSDGIYLPTVKISAPWLLVQFLLNLCSNKRTRYFNFFVLIVCAIVSRLELSMPITVALKRLQTVYYRNSAKALRNSTERGI